MGVSSVSGLLTFVLLGALATVGALAWLLKESRSPGPLEADKVVMIVREDDGGSIADQLERAGVIDSALWFNLLTLLDGNRGALKRGEYEFKAGVSMNDIENELVAHRVVMYKLTIPEGLTSEQIVQRLRDNDVLVGDVKETPREGSLMPDTYSFERGYTRLSVLSRMAKTQTKAIEEVWKGRAPDLPIKSPGEMVTLASIVEKETGKADERPRVAGVFVNRLEKHMRLESDPTIVYGLALGKGTLGRSITKADLNQSTPYNTYIIDGLPPGPICNPGKAALEAVANPARSKDLYFVADGTGGHVFAETFDQHQKNVAHWRQIEKDVKDKLAPDVTPQPAPAIRGSIDPVDPSQFGALVAPAQGQSAPAAILARLSQNRRRPERARMRRWRRWSPRASSRSRKWRRRHRGQRCAGGRAGVRRRGPGRRFRDRAHRLRSRSAGHARGRAGARSQVWNGAVGVQRRRPGRHDDRRARRLAAADGFRPAAHLRRVRRHAARSAAQQDLRPELRQGRAVDAIGGRRRPSRRVRPRRAVARARAQGRSRMRSTRSGS